MFKFLTKQKKEDKIIENTSNRIARGLDAIFNSKKLDENTLEELEELLISTDVNIYLINDILNILKKNRYNKETTANDVKDIIYNQFLNIFKNVQTKEDAIIESKPHVILFLGVNGSGKTTFIGKMAYSLASKSKKVLLAACDTFRAGAKEQLTIWAEKSKTDIFLGDKDKEEPASVAFKAYDKAVKENYDYLLIDTAGRLQNDVNLMNELSKIYNVLNKVNNNIPHESILVLDATVGQNSISQAELFNQAVKIDGIVMNKLDGTAKGGSLVSIVYKLKKPIIAIGVGEGIEDIKSFDSEIYLNNLLRNEKR